MKANRVDYIYGYGTIAILMVHSELTSSEPLIMKAIVADFISSYCLCLLYVKVTF